jgi:tellurite resistance protein TerC
LGTPLLWAIFLIVAAVAVGIDLFSARGKEITGAQAGLWTGIWITLSLVFAGALHWLYGSPASFKFLTAYVIEYALSVDNLFVFIVIFSYFKVSRVAQHKLLYWGIIGAFLLRGTLIGLGTQLVQRFEWVLYFFGAFLLFTAYKLLFQKAEEEAFDVEGNPVFRWARRVLPIAQENVGVQFTTRENGRFSFTPLFLVLLLIEASDVLFALDSIPAVMGISQDPFLVFTSNACAILGLRSLFFLVSSLMDSFRYLKIGLGFILAFVGFKLMAEAYFHEWAHLHEGVVIAASLGFIALTLVFSIVASVVIRDKTLASPLREKKNV